MVCQLAKMRNQIDLAKILNWILLHYVPTNSSFISFSFAMTCVRLGTCAGLLWFQKTSRAVSHCSGQMNTHRLIEHSNLRSIESLCLHRWVFRSIGHFPLTYVEWAKHDHLPSLTLGIRCFDDEFYLSLCDDRVHVDSAYLKHVKTVIVQNRVWEVSFRHATIVISRWIFNRVACLFSMLLRMIDVGWHSWNISSICCMSCLIKKWSIASRNLFSQSSSLIFDQRHQQSVCHPSIDHRWFIHRNIHSSSTTILRWGIISLDDVSNSQRDGSVGLWRTIWLCVAHSSLGHRSVLRWFCVSVVSLSFDHVLAFLPPMMTIRTSRVFSSRGPTTTITIGATLFGRHREKSISSVKSMIMALTGLSLSSFDFLWRVSSLRS